MVAAACFPISQMTRAKPKLPSRLRDKRKVLKMTAELGTPVIWTVVIALRVAAIGKLRQRSLWCQDHLHMKSIKQF